MDSKNIFNIELINNKGKQWYQADDCYVKGFAFQNDRLLENQRLVDVIHQSILDGNIDSVLRGLNGNFTAVIVIDNKAYLISDKIRSYPLIFSKEKNGKIYITDNAIGINGNKEIFKELDETNCAEFLSLGYVSGNDTLYRDVYTVDAGEYMVLKDGETSRKSYYKYIHQKKLRPESKIIENAYESLERAFRRTISSLGNYTQIVIPLSGGYDSRLIACLCKKYGLHNVVCYTYGRIDSFEVGISKQVANKLEFEWHYVEYRPGFLSSVIENGQLTQYADFSHNFITIPHIQDLVAVKTLREKGVLQAGAIVIPGFCGDLFGGSKIPKEVFAWKNRRFNLKQWSDLIYMHFYDLNILKRKWHNRVIMKLKKENYCVDISNENNFLDNYEQWCIQNRLSKFIVNSIRLYEFYDMDWRMPLWDDEYAKFWYTVPWRQKNPGLLNKFMFDKYFDCYDVNFIKPCMSAATKFVRALIPSKLRPLVINIRSVFLKPFEYNKNKDINSFSTESMSLYRNIMKEAIYNRYTSSLKRKSIGSVLAIIMLDKLKK